RGTRASRTRARRGRTSQSAARPPAAMSRSATEISRPSRPMTSTRGRAMNDPQFEKSSATERRAGTLQARRGLPLEATAHERLAVVALEGLGRGVGVALLHLLLLARGRGRLQALRHERLPLVPFLVPGLGVARLHLLLLRGELLVGGDARRAGTDQKRDCGDGREKKSHGTSSGPKKK